jgi:outer membrane protein assembly factor BamB
MKATHLFLGSLLATFLTTNCYAQIPKANEGDWPWWRGPNFNGVADGQESPTTWSKSTNVAWVAPIPGRGHSSPTVVGNRIFLTTADEQAEVQSVLCFDRSSGKQLWKQDIHRGGFPSKINRKNTHASTSVACDGKSLYASFLNQDGVQIVRMDMDGKIVWQQDAGKFTPNQYKNGYSASPLIYGDLVIVAGDYDGEGSFLAAHERATGKPKWKISRPAKVNYASAVVAHIASQDQLLLSGGDMVASYAPLTGKLLWKTEATTMATAGTMVWDGEFVFASGGYPEAETACIRADGSGEVVWRNNTKCYEQSMLAAGGFVYAINDNGFAICWDGLTGEEKWRERLQGPVSASPVLVGDRIYASNERGTTWVFRATPEKFDLIAKNQLGSEAFASPTICGNKIFLRVADSSGEKRQEFLYCIE